MPTTKGNDNVVTLNEREFVLSEPDYDVVLRILNVVGDVGLRAEGKVRAVLDKPTDTALIFGLLAAMQPDDLLRLGAAVLQFETEEEGVTWLREHGVKIAPIVKAFVINISLSTDLVEALENFIEGIGLKVPKLKDQEANSS